MNLEIVGEIFTINQEETMEKVKQVWALSVTNKKIVIIAAVAIIILISLVN